MPSRMVASTIWFLDQLGRIQTGWTLLPASLRWLLVAGFGLMVSVLSWIGGRQPDEIVLFGLIGAITLFLTIRGAAGAFVACEGVVARYREPVPCASEIGRQVGIPPRLSDQSSRQFTIPQPGSQVRGCGWVYAQVNGHRFEPYRDEVGEFFALCAPIYLLNRSNQKANLMFEFIEVERPAENERFYLVPITGIESFNINYTLGPGESTRGCLRALSVPKEQTETDGVVRILWLREMLSNSWIRVPIPGNSDQLFRRDTGVTP